MAQLRYSENRFHHLKVYETEMQEKFHLSLKEYIELPDNDKHDLWCSRCGKRWLMHTGISCDVVAVVLGGVVPSVCELYVTWPKFVDKYKANMM